MDSFTQSDLVEVRRDSNKGRGGRGVFARRLIAESTLIERVPVLLIPKDQVFGESQAALRACRLSWYVFGWGVEEGHDYVAVALGYGSLYNHSYKPNGTIRLISPDVLEVVAITEINEGEEITINYNGDPGDNTPVNFLVAP